MRGTQKERDHPEPEDEATEGSEKGKPETRKEYRREKEAEGTKQKDSGRADMKQKTNERKLVGRGD